MDVFNSNYRGFIIMERLNILKIFCISLFLLLTAFTASAQEQGKMAVLPFVINAQDMPDNLAASLQGTLSTAISEKGYEVVSSDSVNRHPLALKTSLEASDLQTIGKDLGADRVVSGALNKSDEKFILTVTVSASDSGLSTTNFYTSDSLDLVPEALKKAAENIDYLLSGISFVTDIQVKGNKRIESAAILANIETQKGDRFDQDLLNQDLRTIIKMGYFKDVQIEIEDKSDGKGIVFDVVEYPYITKILFEGNKEYKEDKLTEEIGIKRFAVLNPSEVKQSINKLKEYYKKNGYYNAAITDRIDELPDNQSSLTYVIDEGKKVYVTKIEFLGNEVFSDKQLLKQIKTNSKGFFYWLTSSGVLEQKDLDDDVSRLTIFYLNQGYVEAKIGEPEITYDKEKGLTITINIIEGKRYKVGEVHIEGDLIRPEEAFLALINTNKLEYLSNEVLYEDIDLIKNACADEGYAYADVNKVMKEDEKDPSKINTTFIINKNKKVRVERINIKGNERTRDKVIRRELKLVEGDYFSSSKLEKSKTNLNRLSYLENPDIKIRDGSTDDQMVLDVEVTDAQRGTFNIGAGYSSFDRLFFSVSVSLENLFGRGQSASVDASIGSRTTEYNLTFTEPWLFDKNVSGTINLYNQEVEYDDFTKDSRGLALGTSFLVGLDDYTRASLSYAYDKAYVTSIYSTYSTIMQDMIGENIKSSVTAGIGRDTRDTLWGTHKGSVNSITLESAGGVLGGTSSFDKFNVVSTWYFPVWWNNIIMVKGMAGLVVKGDGGKLPIYEKFMLGGEGSVRGYDSLSISPKDTATGESIGGDRMWLGNLEYRIPILEDKGVLGLLFFDVGNAYNREKGWRLGAKRSFGFGIKWRASMTMPISLTYAIKLDKEKGEDAGEFEFNMSY